MTQPSYYIVTNDDLSIRFFCIGYFIDNQFTGMLHDYCGGGEYQQALVYNDQFIPTTDLDGEPLEWGDMVALWEFFSRLPYHELESATFKYLEYNTEQFNYVLLPEYKQHLNESGVLIHNCSLIIPYGLGNTSFIDGYPIDTMELTRDLIMANCLTSMGYY